MYDHENEHKNLHLLTNTIFIQAPKCEESCYGLDLNLLIRLN